MPTNLRAMAGQFKGAASHGAAQIQRPGLWRQARGVEAFAHATDWKLERIGQSGGQAVFVPAIMKKQIFRNGAVAVVIIFGHGVLSLGGEQLPQIGGGTEFFDDDFLSAIAEHARLGHEDFRRFGGRKQNVVVGGVFGAGEFVGGQMRRPNDRCGRWRRGGCREFFRPGCRGPTGGSSWVPKPSSPISPVTGSDLSLRLWASITLWRPCSERGLLNAAAADVHQADGAVLVAQREHAFGALRHKINFAGGQIGDIRLVAAAKAVAFLRFLPSAVKVRCVSGRGRRNRFQNSRPGSGRGGVFRPGG